MIAIGKWVALFNIKTDNTVISEQQGDNPFGTMTVVKKTVNVNGVMVSIAAARVNIGHLTTIVFSTDNFEYTLLMTAKEAWSRDNGERPYVINYANFLYLTVIPYRKHTPAHIVIKTTKELADEEFALISLAFEDIPA